MKPTIVAIVVVVVMAGCLGGSPASPQTTSTTTISTTKPTTATTTTTRTATTSASAPVFDYGNLSRQSRADFRRLLSNGSVDSPDPLFGPRIVDEHYDTFAVEYDGTEYEIRHQRRQTETRVCLQSVEPVENASIGDGDVVGTYANLSDDAQHLFDRVAAGNDTDTCYDPSHYPLSGYTHIKHEGTYYGLVEMHGSTYTYHYSISRPTATTTG